MSWLTCFQQPKFHKLGVTYKAPNIYSPREFVYFAVDPPRLYSVADPPHLYFVADPPHLYFVADPPRLIKTVPYNSRLNGPHHLEVRKGIDYIAGTTNL